MQPTYLGIDCGTQGTKALVMDSRGTTLGVGYAKHALIERASGAREQEPAWWVEAMRHSVKSALSSIDPAQICAIGVSGQQHGLVILDEHQQVIRPAKLWNDTETAPENAELIERLGGEQACLQHFGIIPRTGYTASKLLWIAHHEPDNFKRMRHILLPHEYLNFWLTGRMYAEAGDASGTGFFDPRSLTWATDVLRKIDGATDLLARSLPAMLGADEIVGTVLPKVAREFGLHGNCLVSVGGGDNMMGAIGTGNVREGIVTLSLGTSATVYSFSTVPSLDKTGYVAPFCSSSGGWLPLVCTMNATNVVTQTVATVGKTVDDIDEALAATEPGAGGLTFLPFLNGERTPDLPSATGTLVGLSANNFTPNNLIRAAIEGVSFGILNGFSMILQGRSGDRIRVIGGGARSRGWCRLLADASGAIIEVPTEEEAGCLGAAIQALYVYSRQMGKAESLDSIAQRCVRLDDAKTVWPNPALAAGYHQAAEVYQRRLRELYVVS